MTDSPPTEQVTDSSTTEQVTNPSPTEQLAATPPKTPPKPATNLPVEGTPIAGKISGMQPHASADTDRNKVFKRLREEITGKIIGPVTAESFLEKFMPVPASMPSDSTLRKPAKFSLDKIRNAQKESDMYMSFIGALSPYVDEKLRLVDTHATKLQQWHGADIIPDAVLLDDQSRWQIRRASKPAFFTDRPIEDVGVMLEFKHDDSDDPFTDGKKENNFEILDKSNTPTQAREQTLGQIAAYATAHMATQFRSHVFSLLVFPQYARLMRWDTAGLIVTTKIPFTPAKAMPLAEFFRRYSLASPEERGIDPYVERKPSSYRNSLPEGVADKLSDSPTSFYRFTLPKAGPGGVDAHYVASAPYFMGTGSPTGRSTRGFKAFCERTKKFVFLKDTWRIDSPDLRAEHETYALLKEKGVGHIPTVAAYHDRPTRATETSTQIKPTAKRGNAPNKFRRFIHYRLVLEQFAKPLEEFDHVQQLLNVIRQTMQAHRDAHYKAHILHRDISATNIMIDEDGNGLLVDWDFSKSTVDKKSGRQQPERTGTWQFIAYRLTKEREGDEKIPVHNRMDDVESFWHVLFWVAIRRCEHGASEGHVKDAMAAYDAARNGSDDTTVTPSDKLNLMFNHSLIKQRKFKSPSLRHVLATFQGCMILRYDIDSGQLPHWRENWTRIQSDSGNSTSFMVEAKFRNWLKGADIDIKGLELEYILRVLEPNWEMVLLEEVCNNPNTDWKTGCGRVNTRSYLDTQARTSMKRKQGREYTTLSSDRVELDPLGNARILKKLRTEPVVCDSHLSALEEDVEDDAEDDNVQEGGEEEEEEEEEDEEEEDEDKEDEDEDEGPAKQGDNESDVNDDSLYEDENYD